MKLVQSRIVTEDVSRLAAFYAALVRSPVALNDYYVEVPAGAASIGFSRCRFTEDLRGEMSPPSCHHAGAGETILDLAVPDVDAEEARIDRIGVKWVMPPTDQPWGTRSMLFRDPDGHLVNVFSVPHASHHHSPKEESR